MLFEIFIPGPEHDEFLKGGIYGVKKFSIEDFSLLGTYMDSADIIPQFSI